MPIPLPADAGRAILDHQARHDVDLQAGPPPVGTLLRFQAEAEDRSARGAQVGRSGVVQLQVVSPDELFYEILIRQRAERAKFLAASTPPRRSARAWPARPRPDDCAAAARTLHAAPASSTGSPPGSATRWPR